MKIEIDNQTIATSGVVLTLIIIECLMPLFKVNYTISISIDIALCIFLDVYNYRRFGHFETKKELQLTNKRLAFALLFTNLPCIIGIIAILITLQ